MSEWKEYSFKKIYDFSSGLSKAASEFGSGYPFLSFKEVFNNFFLPENLPNLVNSTNKERESCSIKRGDVFLTRTSETEDELGMSSVALKDYPNATFNGFTKRLRPKNNYPLVSKFVGYYLRTKSFRDQIISMASSTTRASLNNSMLEHLTILAPKQDEQRKIASVLSSLDDKIDLLYRQNQTIEKLAEVLFDSWFEDKDLTNKISDLIDLQNGYAFKSKSFQEYGVDRVLKIKNIDGGIVNIKETDFVSSEVAESIDEKFCIKTGDILFAMTGAKIGKLGIIPKTDYRLWLNQRVGLLKEKYDGSRFLAYLQLKSEYGKDYIENTATGSAQPNISGTGIENCEFPEISKEQIIEYSATIKPLFEKLISNLGQIRILENLRDTLLPKLMSGEVIISDE